MNHTNSPPHVTPPHDHAHAHVHAHPAAHSPTTALVLGAGPRIGVALLASALLWLVVGWALS